jgi:hypothetical protein
MTSWTKSDVDDVLQYCTSYRYSTVEGRPPATLPDTRRPDIRRPATQLADSLIFVQALFLFSIPSMEKGEMSKGQISKSYVQYQVQYSTVPGTVLPTAHTVQVQYSTVRSEFNIKIRSEFNLGSNFKRPNLTSESKRQISFLKNLNAHNIASREIPYRLKWRRRNYDLAKAPKPRCSRDSSSRRNRYPEMIKNIVALWF